MNNNGNIGRLILKLIGIVIGFTVAIVAIYIWLIPSFFKGYGSYSFFVAGLCGAAWLAGRLCMKVNNPTQKANLQRLIISCCCGLLIAILVASFSMLIIVNTIGV